MERLVGEAGQPWMGWAWEHRSEPQAQASLAAAGRTLIPRRHQEACLSTVPQEIWALSTATESVGAGVADSAQTRNWLPRPSDECLFLSIHL